MHGWFCPIHLIHLIEQKSVLHFDKKEGISRHHQTLSYEWTEEMFNYHCHLNHTNSAQKTVITLLRLREMVSGDSPCVVIHRSSDDVVKSLCYRLHANITVLLTLSKILTSMPININYRFLKKNSLVFFVNPKVFFCLLGSLTHVFPHLSIH